MQDDKNRCAAPVSHQFVWRLKCVLRFRMADLMTVKDKMVSDERYQREALESKLRRICSRV